MSNNPTKLGVAPNVAGLLCNLPCIGFIFSIVAVVVEKENRFVRFHALQSLLLHGAMLVCAIAVQIASLVAVMIMGLLGFLINLVGVLVAFGFLGTQIFMMVKAFGKEEFRLPLIGDLAAQWV